LQKREINKKNRKMGKIKSKMIKRSAEELVKRGIEFNPDFDSNKKALGNTMPSKKIRNQVAGYLSRLKRREAEKKAQQKSFLQN
jgi:ribosomal protein S17E